MVQQRSLLATAAAEEVETARRRSPATEESEDWAVVAGRDGLHLHLLEMRE